MNRFVPTLLALAVTFASSESMAAADLILVNGKIFTADRSNAQVQAIAIDDGKIVAVGNDDEVRRFADNATQVIDLGGKRVTPGLIDSHSHSVFGGLELAAANMEGESVSVDELEKRLRNWRADGRAKLGEFLQVVGMNSSDWSKAEAFGQRFNQGEWADTPIVFVGGDHHTAWANNAMLKRAGIDKAFVASLSKADSTTIGTLKNGEPSGFLVDACWDRVAAVLPPVDAAGLQRAAKAAVRYNNSFGITAWMDPAANGAPGEAMFAIKPTEKTVGVLPAYKALAQSGELTAHVAALLVVNPKSRPADLEVIDKVRQQFMGIPNLTLPGIKVFADGVLEFPAQSAALLDHYSNSHKRGELLLDPAHFGELVTAADQRGWLVHVHAIGDRAVRESLNGIAQARKAGDSGITHSITHLQLVNPAEFARFKPLNVIASMQLLWAAGDEYTQDMVKPYVDSAAYRYQYPARSLLKNGATIAGASDWPVSSPNPWLAIAQAATREGPEGVLNADESLDRETMLYAYTINAAKTIGLEQQIGSLSKGKQADFVILDRDVFAVSDKDVSETQVLATYFGGKPVYTPSK